MNGEVDEVLHVRSFPSSSTATGQFVGFDCRQLRHALTPLPLLVAGITWLHCPWKTDEGRLDAMQIWNHGACGFWLIQGAILGLPINVS